MGEGVAGVGLLARAGVLAGVAEGLLRGGGRLLGVSAVGGLLAVGVVLTGPLRAAPASVVTLRGAGERVVRVLSGVRGRVLGHVYRLSWIAEILLRRP